MPRLNPPKARLTPREKALLLAASKATAAKAQEILSTLMVEFCKTPAATFPSVGVKPSG